MRVKQTKEELKQRTVNAVIPDDPNLLLDEFQLAKIMGCSVFKLRRDRWAGGGVPFLKINGMVRYRKSDTDTYQQSCLRRSTSDPGPKKAA